MYRARYSLENDDVVSFLPSFFSSCTKSSSSFRPCGIGFFSAFPFEDGFIEEKKIFFNDGEEPGALEKSSWLFCNLKALVKLD